MSDNSDSTTVYEVDAEGKDNISKHGFTTKDLSRVTQSRHGNYYEADMSRPQTLPQPVEIDSPIETWEAEKRAKKQQQEVIQQDSEAFYSRKHHELTNVMPWLYQQALNHLRVLSNNTKEIVALLEAERNVESENRHFNHISYQDYMQEHSSQLRDFCIAWKSNAADRQAIDKMVGLYDKIEVKLQEQKAQEERERQERAQQEAKWQRERQEELDIQDQVVRHYAGAAVNDLRRRRRERERE